jgi:uncharacterized protein (TIGR04255 family)
VTTMDRQPYPEYENPPLTEVACGLVFQPIQSLLTPHIGLLWEKFKPDYPGCQEMPPLSPSVEVDGNTRSEVTLEWSDIPPLPRVWFIDNAGSGIIQVQRDRFLYNWRKGGSLNDYPRYDQVFGRFQAHLSKFNEFLQETNLEEINPIQYELTYVNHIVQGEGWNNFQDIEKIFPFLSSHFYQQESLDLEAINWRLTFSLPGRAGRLHIVIRNGIRQQDRKPVLLFELVARSMGENQSLNQFEQWFNLAHRQVVKTFNQLTSQGIKENIWKYQND